MTSLATVDSGSQQVQRKLTLSEAMQIAGTLGYPSKMPGTSYGLPADACITGSVLANVPGSVCSTCYALKDRYTWTNAQKAQRKRLAGIMHPRWVDAMVRLLLHKHAKPTFRIDLGVTGQRLARNGGVRYRFNVSGFHRWHDSGDLQSVRHLARICEVAARTPRIKHWLPTQELGIVKRYLATSGIIPPNLVIRSSSVMLDDQPRRAWPTTSSVFTVSPPSEAHICPAPTQGSRCGDCRACWSSSVAHVAYARHG